MEGEQKMVIFFFLKRINKKVNLETSNNIPNSLQTLVSKTTFPLDSKACPVLSAFVNDARHALSEGIFPCTVHFCFNGLPRYFSLINTVYAHR